MTDLDIVALLDPLLVRLADLIAERVKGNGNGNGNGHASPEPDTLITADAAAQRLGMTRRWLYSHSHDLPFAVKLPNSRAIRFSVQGIAKWVARRQG